MSHFCSSLLHGIEYFERWHQFVGAVYLDLQAVVAEAPDRFRQPVGSGAEAGKVPWPRRDHFPFEGLI